MSTASFFLNLEQLLITWTAWGGRGYRARFCKRSKEPRNQFQGIDTTRLLQRWHFRTICWARNRIKIGFAVPAQQAKEAGGTDSLESIPGAP
jgi:hypothetical protein